VNNNFIISFKGLGKDFLRNLRLSKWGVIAKALRNHLLSGWPSDELRIECETAITLIPGALELSQVPIAVSNLAVSSSQLLYQSTMEAHNRLDSFVRNIDVTTTRKMEIVAQDFIKEAMKSKQSLEELTQFAVILNERFTDSALTFKEAVTSHLQSSYCELSRSNADSDSQVESLIKFIGQFYNIGWISKEFLETLFEGFLENAFENDYKFNLFRELLQVVSSKLIENRDCGRFVDYDKILKMRKN
jgi:hypothetical protein